MLDWTKCTAVERDPARVSGAWVFSGTRVPVKALFENVEDGARVDDFLAWFPGVSWPKTQAHVADVVAAVRRLRPGEFLELAFQINVRRFDPGDSS